MKTNQLIDTLAQICYYAQEHTDIEVWDEPEFNYAMTHVSHIVACFLSENTKYGDEGVDSNIVLNLLMQARPYEEWQSLMKRIVLMYEQPS